MGDPITRAAARVAVLVAVPVALVAGFVAFRVLDTGDDPTVSGSTGAPSRPRSTAPVQMPAPPLGARAAAVCRALAATLPDHLGDLVRRPVTAGADQNAAYGDPAVTVACGTPGPSAPPAADYLEINGICWYPERGVDAATWTLRGHEVPVVVTVPTEYTGQYLADLAKPVSDAVAQTSTGCG
jgi:hypothetical protein